MAASFKKDPNDIVDFSIDWTNLLELGETILTSTYMFYTVAGMISTDIVEDSSSNTNTITTIFISGGEVNTNYIVSNKITTSGSRTFERSFYLHVLELFI